MIYNKAAGEILDFWNPPIRMTFFLKTHENQEKIYKPNGFLTVLVFTKIHLENRYHFFALRISLFDRDTRFLSHVCSDFNIFFLAMSFASIYLPRSARPIVSPNPIFALRKKVLVAPAPSTILTKHIVRLRCRCSCEIDRTSAVALLEISETLLFLS